MPRKYSRRRRSSKSSTKRRKSKKMRGGVTVRAQDLNRLPLDVFGEIREMHPLLTPKLTNATIKRAVKDYNINPRAKREVIKLFGKIENWDVSNVTNMDHLFYGANYFNQPLNKWNVSKVEYMNLMFYDTMSFNQPLDKWDVSNVRGMDGMFFGAHSFNVSNALDTFQLLSGWLKDSAPANINSITLTLDTFQLLSGWLKEVAFANIPSIFVTLFMEATSFNQPLHAPWLHDEGSESE